MLSRRIVFLFVTFIGAKNRLSKFAGNFCRRPCISCHINLFKSIIDSLYSTAAFWTTTVMRKRSHINDLCNLNTGTVYCTNSRLAACTRSFYICLNFTQSKVKSYFSTTSCCCLSSIRSILLRTSETHFACRRPADYLTFVVGQSNNYIVKSRRDMGLPVCVNLYNSLFICCSCLFCHDLGSI